MLLSSIEGVDLSQFDCVYSPAKRRGPVPGRTATRKAPEPQQQQWMQPQPQSLNGFAYLEEPSARRVKMDLPPSLEPTGIPHTITKHTHLLEKTDPEGVRLRSYYALSIDELYQLPPTDDHTHHAALTAVRFAEVALGALVRNDVSLAMELCNAVVHCLRESVYEPVQAPLVFEVAKAYFLLGVFRACRGDMERYFKYRRVCMTYLAKLEVSEGNVMWMYGMWGR